MRISTFPVDALQAVYDTYVLILIEFHLRILSSRPVIYHDIIERVHRKHRGVRSRHLWR